MKHWSILSRAWYVFGISFILSAALVFFSYEYYSDISYLEGKEANKFGAAEKEYTEIQETLEILNPSFLKKYDKLIEKGFFINEDTFSIEEQRLEIFNNLKQQLSQFPLFTANYTISETRLYQEIEIEIEIDKRFKLYETEISLKLTLLHEEDLLNLIESIKLKGLFRIKRCNIQRIHEKIVVHDVSKAYIKATCVLAWYVMGSIIDLS
jgi:hypothetical protein